MTERQRPMEKHIQTILLVIITGLLGWAGLTLVETKEKVAVMQVNLETIAKQTDQFITRSEVDQRSKIRDMQLHSLEQRVNALENKSHSGK